MCSWYSTHRIAKYSILTHSDPELPLLISGYMREHQKSINKQIPKELNSIILKQYDCYRVYDGIFQKSNISPNAAIINDIRIEYDNYTETRRFEINKLNKPILMDQENVYVWQISMKYFMKVRADGIGVVSESDSSSSSNYEFYGISMTDNRKYYGRRSFINTSEYEYEYTNDDIITIEIDCILYELIFRSLNNKNKIIYGPLKLIKSRKKWYPAVLFTPKSNKTQCKFIKYKYKNMVDIDNERYKERLHKLYYILGILCFNILFIIGLSMLHLRNDIFLSVLGTLIMYQISTLV